ncbi:response regulator [Bradyrhizobium arachidis]|uniref:response regulator n=1 Tax=Bradyrhizobium arachidis TaxID=858423 RepID=UPI002162EB1E|nr:response regulator [Bradyrhizobium arachidis]
MAHTLNIISVVCDDQSVREPLMDMIIAAGCVAELFRSADEFLSSKSDIRTSCLIADMQLTSASGLDLYEQLIASGKTIPTILLVAGPDDDNRARALQAGVSQVLRKPFDKGELLACIKSTFKDRKTIRGRP